MKHFYAKYTFNHPVSRFYRIANFPPMLYMNRKKTEGVDISEGIFCSAKRLSPDLMQNSHFPQSITSSLIAISALTQSSLLPPNAS